MNALVVWFLGALALLISCCGPASAQSATEDHSSSESTPGEMTEPPAAPEPDPPPLSSQVEITPSPPRPAPPTLDVRFETLEGEDFLRAIGASVSSYDVRRLLAVFARPEPLAGEIPPFAHGMATHVGTGRLRFASGERRGGNPVPEGVIGRFETSDSPPFIAHLAVRGQVLDTIAVTEATTELVFRVDIETWRKTIGSVRGRVIDAETRQPLENAEFRLGTSQADDFGSSHYFDEITMQGSLVPGAYLLRASYPGYESRMFWILLDEGEHLDFGEFELHRATTLEGVVRAPDGTGVQASLKVAPVELVDPEAAGFRDGTPTFSSDAKGAFEIPRLGRRAIIVRAIGPQWMGATVVDLEEGRLDDFVLEVAPAVPVTIWTRAGALDPVSFEITDAQGTRLEVVTTRRPKHLIHLSAGAYTIRWGEGLDRSRKKALTVGSEPTDVRLGR